MEEEKRKQLDAKLLRAAAEREEIAEDLLVNDEAGDGADQKRHADETRQHVGPLERPPREIRHRCKLFLSQCSGYPDLHPLGRHRHGIRVEGHPDEIPALVNLEHVECRHIGSDFRRSDNDDYLAEQLRFSRGNVFNREGSGRR